MEETLKQYQSVKEKCKEIFIKKTKDYGTSWRVLRTISVVDQIYIKAQRIRNIQETGIQKIDDDVLSEFIGIINYSIIGLIQLVLTEDDPEELNQDQAELLYTDYFNRAEKLMQSKNHDYGEAWRNMSQESFVDLILTKLQRMKQILTNRGKTLISEGLDANYFDILNYAVFAMIMNEEAIKQNN